MNPRSFRIARRTHNVREDQNMLKRFCRLAVGLTICLQAGAACAINRSWDDEGGTADKSWTNAGNWSPDGTPAAADVITIGNLADAANDTTILDTGFTISALTLSNGADIDTSGNELIVNGVTTLGGAGVNIFVDPRTTGDNDGLDSEGIVVNSGATLQVLGQTGTTDGGIVELESGVFEINSGGAAGGHGTIQLMENGPVGQVMENSGRLFVSSRPGNIFGVLPGTLTITHDGTGTGTMDLDGDSETGVVDVDDGVLVINATALTLNIEVPIADTFNGQMDIGNADTVNITSGWTRGNGTLNFNGSSTHTLQGGTLTVNGASADVNANGGTTVFQNNLTVSDGNFVLADSATVQFDGTATFADTTDFANNSHTTIIVNGTLNVGDGVVAAGEDFNWDAGGFIDNTTIVNATGVFNIIAENIDAGADDTYNGTITMNSGNVSVNVSDNLWVMAGVLNMANTTGADIPLLSGDAIQIGDDSGSLDSDINVSGTGTSQISPAVTFMSDADVDVATGTTLRIDGNVTFNSVNGVNNAEFTGGGTLQLNGGANLVAEGTTIDMPSGRVDLDGVSVVFGAGQTLTVGSGINSNDDLTLNVTAIGTTGNSFGRSGLAVGADTIVLNDFSDLAVNLTDPNGEWTLNAAAVLTINAVGGAFGGSGIQGSDFMMAGTANITGNSLWNARTDITGTVNVGAASSLNLRGGTLADFNRLQGGTITGAGALRALTDEGLAGFGTINTDIEFSNNTELRADDGTMTVNAPITDVGVIGTNDADGILDVTVAWNTNVTNSVELKGGEIRGAAITNGGANGINGFGLLSAPVNNNTRIDAENGPLLVQTPGNNNEWDGTGNTGALNAVSGNLELRDNAAFAFSGTVAAAAGQQVFANGFELDFQGASTINLNGGKFKSTESTHLRGALNVAAGPDSTMELDVGKTLDFTATSVTTLTGNLVLNDDTTAVRAGATFAGGGSLKVVNPGTLLPESGANINVLVDSSGNLNIAGGPAGRVDMKDYQQNASGRMQVGVGGVGLAQFDRLVISGGAQLSGGLDLSLLGGFLPSAGQTFNIISATGGVSGSFTSVLEPVGMPAGLLFDVVYSPTLVQLMVVNAPIYSADFDLDGDVDGDDLTVWKASFGVDAGADADGDGDSDGADFMQWQQQLGSVPAVPAAGGVPEPASGPLALALLLMASTWRGRRRGS
jgi:hypothetical protein